MNSLIRISCALALMAGTANAADLPSLPAKAPVKQTFFTPYNGSGFYVGLEAGGGAGSAGVSGVQGVNNAALTVTQGLVGGILGYSSDMANGQRYWFVEGDVGWNNFNGNTAGFSLTGPVSIQMLAGVGAPASQILAFLPTFGITPPTLPSLPAGVTSSNPHIYIAAGVDIEDVSLAFNATSHSDWQFAPMVALGVESQLSTGGVLGARIEEVINSDAVCLGGQCTSVDLLTRAKVLYKF